MRDFYIDRTLIDKKVKKTDGTFYYFRNPDLCS